MILRAYYMDKQVLLNVPTNNLVYDGKNFVDPALAKTVVLITTGSAQATVPVEYPIERFYYLSDVLTWTNYWVCKVIGIQSDVDQLPTDVITADPPTDGMCVCGVTCNGLEIQQVPVY